MGRSEFLRAHANHIKTENDFSGIWKEGYNDGYFLSADISAKETEVTDIILYFIYLLATRINQNIPHLS